MIVRYPALYQINTRDYLCRRSRTLQRPATFDDIADDDLARWAETGFDWLWWLGVWRAGPAARAVSLADAAAMAHYRELLPDFTEADVAGSCFAIQAYEAADAMGGDDALRRLRARMHRYGLKLMLDFVPNHTAPDHPWVYEHPEFYVTGTEADLAREPRNYTRLGLPAGERIFAHGRDPYFDGWADTLQLDYSNPALRAAMRGQLARIAQLCDGVRCDMAMLVLPDVFARTWGRQSEPFWPDAIRCARASNPDFVLMAEVYWDLEWELQRQGFDYCYDKRLYDRLRGGPAGALRAHLSASLEFQDGLARFLENHDEPRAAHTFSGEQHRAAAAVAYLAPGLRFFHNGQLEGRREHVSMHLRRGPDEERDAAVHEFYQRLLEVLRRDDVRQGPWRLLEAVPAWEGNASHGAFVCYAWGESLLVTVNYAPHRSQCYVRLPWSGGYRLTDLLSDAVYDRSGDLYLDLAPWGVHAFEVDHS